MINQAILCFYCLRSGGHCTYSLRRHQEIFYDWVYFSEYVKHQVRYVFFRSRIKRTRSVLDEVKVKPYEILEIIGAAVEELGLIKD